MTKLFNALIAVMILAFTANAQIYISGALSGTLEDTTYIVDGDIWVSNGDSLTIEAGATLIFDEGFCFDIYGYIHAAGTETDSVKFINSPDLTWGGIDFNNSANDYSRLDYYIVTGSDDTGISCGVYFDPTIENCTISGNTADNAGDGIHCYHISNPTIENCTINGNEAFHAGGGIHCYDSSPTGVNNIIWANSAPTGSQIYLSGSSFACTYSDIQDGWSGTGNINADPLFVDPLNSDFHLQSASPCIDAGNPAPQYNDPEDPANPGFALYPAMGTIVNDMGTYGG